MRGKETSLNKANSAGSSLRTTVPSFIKDQFGLEEGDKLSWELGIKDNDLIILVKPVKKEEIKKEE